MTILQVEHAVDDFEAWKRSFDGDPVGRERGGVRRYRISRPADDPSHVVVDLEFDSAEEADAFRAKLNELWSRVGGELGLQRPQARILEEAESREY